MKLKDCLFKLLIPFVLVGWGMQSPLSAAPTMAETAVVDDPFVMDEKTPGPLVSKEFLKSGVEAQVDNKIPDQYIVIFKSSTFSAKVRASGRMADAVASLSQAVATKYGATVKNTWAQAVTGMSVRMSASAAKAMAKDPNVELVEQDQVVRANGTQTPVTWGLDRTDQRDLPLSNSYTYASGAAPVTAYVIDTGIRTTHTEFASGRAVWGTNTTGDGNNTDCHGHGTHVAGTVGGTVYGMAKSVRLVAVKVLNCSGSGSNTGVISGIDWVIANKRLPAVANMSLGGGYSAALNQAVTNATTAGITMVVAAGNDYGMNACSYSPASTPAAITVGSTTSTDARSNFSNIGTCLDIFAPGSSITSAYNSSDTATASMSGTSMASPHVAGAAALYLNDNPSATPAAVASALTSVATPNKVTDPGTGSPNKLVFVGPSNVWYLNVTKTGSGTVTSAPAGINCGTTCSAAFTKNSTVVLTAAPVTGWTFAGWTGACTGTATTCNLSMTSDKAVGATFRSQSGSEIFPLGGVWPSGWITTTGSATAWNLSTDPVYEGSVSMKSGTVVGNYQFSGIEVTRTFAAGNVTFNWTVSSEAGYDWLYFYVDGIQVAGISGCSTWTPTCWQSYSRTLTAGTHTLKWVYSKDGSVSSGRDAGWLDNVVMPVAGLPSAPSGLTASSISSSQINLVWADNSNNETGFKIERKTGSGGTWAQIATLGANATTYSSTGLTAGTTYYYRVRASNASGDSGYSNEAYATTQAGPPSAPVALSATAASASQINLAWADNSNNETGFKIERKTGSGGSWAQIATVGANVGTYASTGLTASTIYYYRVRAYNAAGDSGYSNEAYATTAARRGLLNQPVGISPSGTTTVRTPTYTWTALSTASWYYLYVVDTTGERVMTWYTAAQAGCASGTGTCAVTPSATLATGDASWWVLGWINNQFPGPWSDRRDFTVIQSGGFDEQFNGGTASNWIRDYGTWTVLNNQVYNTAGVATLSSTSTYNAVYTNLDYSARIWRDGSDTSANRLIVRGSGAVMADGHLTNQYLFQISRGGDFSVFKKVNGVTTTLAGWTSSSAINRGAAWNTLRVVANGSALAFYINGILVWQGTDSSLTSGRVGVGMYTDSATGNAFNVDWATLNPSASAVSGPVAAPGSTRSGGVNGVGK